MHQFASVCNRQTRPDSVSSLELQCPREVIINPSCVSVCVTALAHRLCYGQLCSMKYTKGFLSEIRV